VVNVLGLGGALLARDSGRHVLWGLVLPGYWGYLWSLGRDLTEISAAGTIPILRSGSANLGVPFFGLLRAADHYLGRLPSTAGFL
jgi:hypothetical protein